MTNKIFSQIIFLNGYNRKKFKENLFMQNGFVKYDSFESSNINCLWYSRAKQELIVEYNGGSQYRYNDISEMDWNNLISADSKGKFINENIKSKPYQRMILND